MHDAVEELDKKLQLWKSKSGDKISIGIFYKNELVPTFHERIAKRISFYITNPPTKQMIHDEMVRP